MVILRVIAGWFALFAAMVAFGWFVDQNTAHAVGWVALALLFYVLSTIPTPNVP